jgi:UDP-N-acetylglucosamine:LPS N-acetylglucosamine transferase
MKIAIVCSSGGHLFQMYVLGSWWKKYDTFWVTFKKKDAETLLEGRKTYWAHFPTNRSIKNLIRNLFMAWKILRKERPDLIVSNGAGVAVPFFWLGRLFRIKTIFIEVYDRIDSPSLTGKLVYGFSDEFLLQWEEQKKYYPRGKVLGQVL